MMFYQSSESTGRADENVMRAMPWAEMMTLFKKAHKIEELEHTAKFPNAAGTNANPHAQHSPPDNNKKIFPNTAGSAHS